MSTMLRARHYIVDDFLTEADADRLLNEILVSETRFTPSTIATARDSDKEEVHRDHRSSLRLSGQVSVNLTGVTNAIRARFDEICVATGVQHFPVYYTECSIVAHNDGDFYKRHVDTGASFAGHVRLVSCVYYLHRRPCRFSGGELAIYPFDGNAKPERIKPVHNRLVAFPAFVPHEVFPTSSSGAFGDSRFSINCWLHREVKTSVTPREA